MGLWDAACCKLTAGESLLIRCLGRWQLGGAVSRELCLT